MEDPFNPPSAFSGVARLFPLPNLVLFPGTVQALHIFEPRYRQMAADALATDRRIALVLLKEGWDQNYDGAPAICGVACLGQIVADQLLPDGRYNLLLRGDARIRLRGELPMTRLYRQARAEIVPDVTDAGLDDLTRMRARLAAVVESRMEPGPSRRKLHELFDSDMPLATVCNILAFAVPLPVALKQSLLETAGVLARTGQLAAHFESAFPQEPQAGAEGCDFPPHFSAN